MKWIPGFLGAVLSAAAASGELRKEYWGEARAFYYSSDRYLDRKLHFPGLSLDGGAGLGMGAWDARADVLGYAGPRLSGEREYLKQAYLGYGTESVEVRIGKQIIRWGRADFLNPTDNLNHFDRSLPFAGNYKIRFGDLAARFRIFGEGATWEAVFLPHAAGSRYPSPPGLDLRTEHPGWGPEDWGGAAKADFQGHAADFSLSAFRGIDPAPYLALGAPSLIRYPHTTVLGGDFAAAFGVTGEFAWSHYDPPGTRKDRLFTVLGIERSWAGGFRARAQMVQIHLLEPVDPPPSGPAGQARLAQAVFNWEADADTYALTVNVSRPFLRDELKVSASGMFNATRGDSYLEPRVEYAPGNGWKVSLGGEWYAGPRASLFGRLKDNSCTQAELVRAF